MFCAKMHSLVFRGLKMTKKSLLCLHIELYPNQTAFRFKHEWQHGLLDVAIAGVLGQCKTPLPVLCKARHHGCGSGRPQLPHWGLANDFYWLPFKHLICPSCLKEEYFSKLDCGKFSVWKHLPREDRVLLVVSNRPRAYYSVLKSVGFSTKTRSRLQSECSTVTRFWFSYHPTLRGNLVIFIWGQAKSRLQPCKRIKLPDSWLDDLPVPTLT